MGNKNMTRRQRQRGMSIPGMLIIAIMVGFYIMCTIRLAPLYFDYLTIRDVVQKVADEAEPGATTGEMRRHIANLFNTNQIKVIKATDVQIIRKEGRTILDAGYEARVPIIGRIDAIMNFNDLQVELPTSR